MSQRPPASRPASHSPPDGQEPTLPPIQLRDDAQQGSRQGDPQLAENLEGPRLAPQDSQPLPSPSSQYGRPLQPAPSGEGWRSGPSRDLGVHSMLNPTEPEGSSSSGRRVSDAETGSPQSAVGPRSHFGASPSSASQHTFPGQQPAAGAPSTQSSYSATLPRSRPILTPRSPRSFGIGRGRGQATIDASRTPFLPLRGRAYTAEPGQSATSDIPPMPTPGKAQSQQPYGFPPTASTPRRTSTTMQAPVRTPHSESTSPSISQSSQNPSSSQTSPASYLYKGGPPPSTQGYFPGASFVQAGGATQFGAGPGAHEGSSSTTEGPYSAPPPPSSQQHAQPGHSSTVSRQTSASNPVQILTITTAEGTYDVPVDTQQASRLADEKRARNAGASARFRQRRKEKEREANTTIEKIQSENRDLTRQLRETQQERDFYRGERDRLQEVVSRTPDVRHPTMQAPVSPQNIRAGSFQGPGMALGGAPPQQGPPVRFQQEPPQERAPRRRRTGASGEFASVPYTLPPASTLPPVQSPGYPPGSSNLPPLRIENLSAQTTGPNVTPITSAGPPPPFDPYARGFPGPHERGWPSERGGRR